MTYCPNESHIFYNTCLFLKGLAKRTLLYYAISSFHVMVSVPPEDVLNWTLGLDISGTIRKDNF